MLWNYAYFYIKFNQIANKMLKPVASLVHINRYTKRFFYYCRCFSMGFFSAFPLSSGTCFWPLCEAGYRSGWTSSVWPVLTYLTNIEFSHAAVPICFNLWARKARRSFCPTGSSVLAFCAGNFWYGRQFGPFVMVILYCELLPFGIETIIPSYFKAYKIGNLRKNS